MSTADVSIDDGAIEVTSGLYDTEDGIKLKVAGDAHPRVHITPQGAVKTGDGTGAPTEFDSGAVSSYVYDAGGTQANNVFTSWADLMDAVGSTDGVVIIGLTGNETVPAEGMPTAGWDLNKAYFHGLTPDGLQTKPVLSFADGAKLNPSGIGPVLARNTTLRSQSTEPVVSITTLAGAVGTRLYSSVIISHSESFFHVSGAQGILYLYLSESSLITDATTYASLSGVSLSGGDHENINAEEALFCYVFADGGLSVIGTDTLEGADDITVFVRTVGQLSSISTSQSNHGGTLSVQTQVQSDSLIHTQDDTDHWTADNNSAVSDCLDELASRVYDLENTP